MDRGNALRRIVHLSTPAFLVYYFLPSPLWEGGPTPQLALLVTLMIVLAFEITRLVRGFRVIGMRSYEKEQISAAAWAGIALTITFLFFPLAYAAPLIFGMAVVDPVIGQVRRTKWYPVAPYFLHLGIMITVLALLIPLQPWTLFSTAVVSALARMGVVTWRFLVRHFKYAILIIFIVSASITPSGDMLTQTLFAAPMIGLYLISIVIAFIFGKKRRPAPADSRAQCASHQCIAP
jgi:hypothetical protein